MSPVVPRLQHVLPHGPVTRSHVPLPVVVLISWHDGRQTPEDATALAWTREEVLVAWTTPWGDAHQVWVRAAHVIRRTAPAPVRETAGPVAPESHDQEVPGVPDARA